MSLCEHDTEDVIEDWTTGDCICRACGVVIAPTYVVDGVGILTDQFKPVHDAHYQTLIDFLYNSNLPLRYGLEAYSLYKKISSDRSWRDQTEVNKALLFGSLYVVLHKNGSSMSYKEISVRSDVDKGLMVKVVKQYLEEYLIDGLHPLGSDMSNRICKTLQLPSEITRDINERILILERNDLASLPPSTLIAVLIRKVTLEHNYKIDLEIICDTLGVSKNTVNKHVRKLYGC